MSFAGAMTSRGGAEGDNMSKRAKRRPPLEQLASTLNTIVPALAGAAAVMYAVVRLFYGQFYATLGATPEMVGLGRTELLTQALIGPAMVVLVVTTTISAVLALYIAV